ncbi:MAG: hypothetical protein ACK5M3_16030 [Dysgonomonas sp.]
MKKVFCISCLISILFMSCFSDAEKNLISKNKTLMDSINILNDSINKLNNISTNFNDSDIKKEETKDDTTNRVASKWLYSEDINTMDDSQTYFASLKAEEMLYFDFPYSGGTTVSILVRNKSKKNEVMLQISQGQFLSSYNNNIKVRFGDATAETYSYNEPSDHSSTTIFINNPKKFITNLKKSEKVIIQCGFYQEGNKTIKFDTKGFEWNH